LPVDERVALRDPYRLPRQLIQQRLQAREGLLGLFFLEREFEHARRSELAAGFCLHEAGEALGIDGGFLGKADTDGVPSPLDLSYPDALRQ